MTTEDNTPNILTERYLSDEAEAEFDSIMEEYEKPRRRRRVIRLSAAAAAVAAITLFISKPMKDREPPLDSLVIAEGMMELMNLNPAKIESVTAKPKGSKAIITANLKDGSTHSYILSSSGEGVIQLEAMNNNKKDKR